MKVKLISYLRSNKLLIASILLVLFVYHRILFKYFEQDEWHNYGVQIYRLYEWGNAGLLYNIITSSLPAIQIYNTLNFLIFGVNNVFPAITVLILLIINSILWYSNVFLISKSRLIASFSLIFGYISVMSYQSVTWVLPAVASQLGFLFLNFSLLLMIKYTTTKSIFYLISASIFSLLAIFSKQNTIFILLLMPIIFIFFSNKLNKKEFFKILFLAGVPIIIFSVLYWIKLGSFRFGETRVVIDIYQMFLNTILLPLKSISQLLFPFPNLMYEFSEYLIEVRYNQSQNDLIIQGLLTELISVIVSLFIVITFLSVYRFLNRSDRRSFVVFGLFFILSFLPFAIDKYSTGVGYLESRYYQFGIFALGVLIAYCIKLIVDEISDKHTFLKISIWSLLIVVIVSFFMFQINQLTNIINQSIELTQRRKAVLSFMQKNYNQQAENQFILYTHNTNHTGSSNITGEYFQTGVLYPYLVYTHGSDYADPEFFKDDILWDYTFQGVTSTDASTVGIFYDYAKLKEYVSQNPNSINSIFAVEFDYSNAMKQPDKTNNFYDFRYVEFRDITERIRKDLTQNQND